MNTAEGILVANCFELYHHEDDLCLKFTMEDAAKAMRDYGRKCAEQALKDAAESCNDFEDRRGEHMTYIENTEIITP